MQRRPYGRSRRAVAVAAACALVSSTATACFEDSSAMPAVRDFLIAWQVGNYSAAAGHTVGADRAEVARALADVRSQLDAASMKLGLGVEGQPGRRVPAAITKSGNTAEAVFSVKIDLGENGEPFTYPGRMRLRRVDGRWKVVWGPSVIHPELRDGQRLAVVSQSRQRADVQDSTGRSLLRKAKVSYVGVYPGQLSDPAQTIKRLADVTSKVEQRQLDTERLIGRVRSAPPNQFLNLLIVLKSEHPAMLDRLKQIPGVRSKPQTVPVEAALAPELVGGLGPATADRLQAVGAPYQPGDTIGVSGLQFLFQRRLAGTPTVRVVAQDPAGTHQSVLKEFIGRQEPEVVRTTLDRNTQRQAEAALADLDVPASLVAVRPTNGEVLAVANHRTGGENLAMEGRYPPGLTFGIVSAGALMQNLGMTDEDKTECPSTTTVGDQTFSNPKSPGARRGDDDLQWHFARSCVTTFAQLSSKLSGPALTQTAAKFGFGRDWGLTVPAFSGYVPVPAGDGQKAAVMTGEGGVLASPLAMALTAGAVATGTWRPPLLLQQPQDRPVLPPQPLESGLIDDLQRLMKRSVRDGTARGAKLPGSVAAVHGAVATTSYTVQGKTRTVSWFVGYRSNNLAFAIAVEGNVSAAQLAKRFLTIR